MKIKQLQWDSDFFNKKIGELSPNEAIKVPFNLTQDYDFIIIKKTKIFLVKLMDIRKLLRKPKFCLKKNYLLIILMR